MKSVLDQSKLADLKILDGKLYIPKQRDSFFETINEKLFSECSIWKASLEKAVSKLEREILALEENGSLNKKQNASLEKKRLEHGEKSVEISALEDLGVAQLASVTNRWGDVKQIPFVSIPESFDIRFLIELWFIFDANNIVV